MVGRRLNGSFLENLSIRDKISSTAFARGMYWSSRRALSGSLRSRLLAQAAPKVSGVDGLGRVRSTQRYCSTLVYSFHHFLGSPSFFDIHLLQTITAPSKSGTSNRNHPLTRRPKSTVQLSKRPRRVASLHCRSRRIYPSRNCHPNFPGRLTRPKSVACRGGITKNSTCNNKH